MATRLYTAPQTPPISPAVDGAWNYSFNYRWELTTVHEPPAGVGQPERVLSWASFERATDGTTYNDMCVQFISAPLNGDQTISGAIKGMFVVYEHSQYGDIELSQTVIRVLSNDGSTVRGTLIPAHTTNSGTYWPRDAGRDPAYPLNRKFPYGWTGSGQVPTTVNALDGDRIVIELGYRRVGGGWDTSYMLLRTEDGVSDCAENETDGYLRNGWIEFADTLSFDVPTTRTTATSAEAIYLPDASENFARITAINAEAIYMPTSAERFARITAISAEVVYRINIPGNVKIRLL